MAMPNLIAGEDGNIFLSVELRALLGKPRGRWGGLREQAGPR